MKEWVERNVSGHIGNIVIIANVTKEHGTNVVADRSNSGPSNPSGRRMPVVAKCSVAPLGTRGRTPIALDESCLA